MRPVVLEPADVAYLSALRTPGYVRHFTVSGRSHDEPRRWSLAEAATILKGVTGLGLLGLDLTLTERQTSIGLWAPTWEQLDPWIQQWQLFNPLLLEYRPRFALPPLKPGAVVRLCRIQPARATKYPIESRFGAGEPEGQYSPLVQFLNALPQPKPGATLYIQVLWRRHLTPLTVAFWPHIEILPQGKDKDALAEKKAERYTYDAQIRVLELHEEPAVARQVNYCRSVEQAVRIWARPNANRLRAAHFAGCGRAGVRRLLSAMWLRKQTWEWGSHFNRKPNYTKDELAAVVHPPPPGSNVVRMPRQEIMAHVAPHSMVDLNQHVRRDYEAWRRHRKGREVSGGAVTLSAADVRTVLDRERNGGRGP